MVIIILLLSCVNPDYIDIKTRISFNIQIVLWVQLYSNFLGLILLYIHFYISYYFVYIKFNAINIILWNIAVGIKINCINKTCSETPLTAIY